RTSPSITVTNSKIEIGVSPLTTRASPALVFCAQVLLSCINQCFRDVMGADDRLFYTPLFASVPHDTGAAAALRLCWRLAGQRVSVCGRRDRRRPHALRHLG